MALYHYKGQPTHYDLSQDGTLTNLLTHKILKGQINQHGYKTYHITLEDGRKKRLTIHRMLMETFCPHPHSESMIINHKDGNKLNNNLNNLEWCTQQENVQHAYDTGLNPNICPIYAFDCDKNLVGSWASLADLKRMTNYNYGIIANDCRLPARSKIYGYYWSFSSSPDFEIQEYPNIGVARPIKQLDKNGNLIAIYKSRGEAARELGVNGGHITECCQHKLKSYKGFIWEYLE